MTSPPFMTVITRSLTCAREGNHAFFSHLAHRVVGPFAPESAVLRASVGHQVHACARCLIDMDRTDLELPGRAERLIELVREDSGRESVGRRVDTPDGLFEGRERFNGHHGTEGFLTAQARVGSHSSEQCRWHNRALPGATGK